MKQNKLKSIFSMFSILFLGYMLISSSGNPPNGFTGAPPSNNTCANTNGGCHATGNFSGVMSITGLPATIMANTTYNITINISTTSGNPVRGGFQMTALDASNSPIGSWTNTGSGVAINGQFVEHSGAQTFSGGMVTWTVDWTAPASGSGMITMYSAGVMGNGSGSEGDEVVTTTASGNLMGGAAMMVSITNSANATCFGQCDGSATASASGGVGPPYTYNWSNGQNGPTANNLCAGTYTVTASDMTGASATAQVTITQPTELDVVITNFTNITCTSPIGTATAMASGGTPGYNYNWSHGQNGPAATFVNPGTYTVTVSDANQCTDITQVTIVADTQAPNAVAGPPGVIDCNNSTVTLNGTGSSTGANISYAWTGPGIVSGANTLMPIVNAGGTYTLTVTNSSNGCTASDQTTVTENLTAPVASAGNDMDIDCLNTQVTLDGTLSSQGGNFSYLWSTPNGNIVSGATTLTPVVDASGIYSIVVTDSSNGCTAEDFVTVNDNTSIPGATASVSGPINCINISVTVDGTGSATGGNITYQWSGPCIVSGANSLVAEVNCAGTYCLVVTDNSNGCSSEACVVVNEDLTFPIASAGLDMQLDCINTSVTLDGTGSSQGGNFSYQWTTVGGNIVSGANTLTPEVSAAGTYTLTVTDTNNGCMASDDVIVTADVNAPVADAGSDMELTCVNTTVTLNGNGSSQGGNFSYLWTGPGIVSGANTLTPVVNQAGNYCIEVTDNANGCMSMDCVDVTSNTTEPTVSILTPADLDCNNSSVTIDGSNSSSGSTFTFEWTTTDGNIVSGQNTLIVEVDSPGTYCLTITDLTNGCTATSCEVVNENIVIPTASAGPGMVINCNNASVTLDGAGSSQGANFSYQWSGPNIQSGANTLTPIVGAAGDYTIIVTDETNGCTAESTTSVTETLPPTATATVNSNVDCNGNSTGSATISANDGNPPYSYEWSTGTTESTDDMLPAGTHSFTVTDQDGCTATGTVTITEPDMLVANASATGETSAGANDGTATADPTGGTQAYSFAWSNGGDTQTITDLTPDDYTVTVTDANGCESIETVTVSSFDCTNVTVSIDKTNVTCNGGTDGSATANLMNGSAPITYAWSNGGDTQTISGLEAGTYTVTVTEGSNCEVVGNVTIEEPSALSISSVQQINVACNGESTGEATVEVTGGTPSYTYLWDDPNNQTTQTATNLPAGTYTPTITDANGCTITTVIEITEPPILTANVTSTNESSAGANDGTATSNPMGGVPGYTYLWSNGESTAMIINLPAGEYCVTVTDQNGCTDEGCVTIESIDCSGISTTFSTADASCFGASDGMAAIVTTGGDEPYVYTWSDGGTGENRNDLSAGTYDVTCEDAKGCTTTVSIVINQPNEIILIMSSTMESQPGAGDGTATAEPNGGAGGFTFDWNNGETTPTITGLVGGFYCVTVTDAIGCTQEDCVEVGVGNCGAFLNIGSTAVLCNGDSNGSAFVVASGGMQPFTFEWSNGMMGDSITGLPAGIYEVTATDQTGCQLSGPVEVGEPLPVDALILNQTNPLCEGDSTGVLNGGAEGGLLPYNFEWSNGSTDVTISNLPAGTYSLTVMDVNNCTDFIDAEIVVPPDTILPTVITQSISLYLDANGMVEITADMIDNGTFDNCELDEFYINVDGFDCDDVGTNTVIFAALDKAGNCATADVFVNVWDTIPPILICPDDIITTDCGTPINYDLPVGTDICGDVTSFLADGLPPGANFPVGSTTVVYTGLDLSNNATSCSFTVTVDSDLNAEIGDSVSPSCFSFEDGYATVIPSGGNGPYFIQWSNGENTDTIFNLPSGTYGVSVVDNNGCQVESSITLDEPDPIIIKVDNVSPENGNNMDGSIEITVSGGTNGSYTYEWLFDGMLFSNDEDLFNLATGDYIIIATDTSDCATSDTVFVDFMSNTFLPEIVEELNIQPNPTSGQFNIDIELGETKDATIDIFDYTGKQIQFGQKESILNKTYQFDLSKYPEGVYLVRIVIDEWVISRKIVMSKD